MPTPLLSPDNVARLGQEAFVRFVRPRLRPEDDGKYVAIDSATGDFEIDADDYTATSRLLARCPADRMWIERAGEETAYRVARGTAEIES